MNRLCCGTVAFMTLLLLTTAEAGRSEDALPKDTPLQLSVDLIDGSHLIGIPNIKHVPIEASYAKVDIPLEKIAVINVSGDHKTGSLILQNGDRIKGLLNLSPIQLDTVFGKVSIKIETIKSMCINQDCRIRLSMQLRNALILYYSFDSDEGEKITDKSGKTYHGNAQGAKWTPTGKTGGGCRFNGRNDCLQVPGAETVPITNAITIAAWVKPFSFYSNMQIAQKDGAKRFPSFTLPILSDHGGSEGGGCNPRRFGLEMDLDGQFRSGMWSSTPLNVGEWQHLLATYDGQRVVLYLNGKKDAEYPVSGRITMNPLTPIMIGCFRAENRDFLNGVLDDIMIFNQSLTPEEVDFVYKESIRGEQ